MDIRHRTNKIGILPYYWHDGTLYVLIHLPKAKNPAEQEAMIWGLARGTARDADNQDIREPDALSSVPPEQIQDHWETARHEAWEELGIAASDILSHQDHGLLDYASPSKGNYAIHFFSAELPPGRLEACKRCAQDAADLQWKTLNEIETMAEAGEFKRGYVPIIRQIAGELEQNRSHETQSPARPPEGPARR